MYIKLNMIPQLETKILLIYLKISSLTIVLQEFLMC